MTTRELIQTQIDRLNDDELQQVSQFIENLQKPLTAQQPASGLLAKLRKLTISGPADFAENVDAYLNGAQHDSANLP
ncbi:MAG: hypothetical protein RLZZ511_2579 [Cyanobacteriota bacterium]|jgi:hypothetical protein